MNLPRGEQELKELCVEFAEFAYNLPYRQGFDIVCDEFIAERNKPKLIEGLTKEQWEQAIDDGLLCEFWDNTDKNNYIAKITKLVDDTDVEFYSSKYASWKHCRIHRSQPQFNTGKKPNWLDDKQIIVARLSDGLLVTRDAGGMLWELDTITSIIRWQAVKL